MKKLKNLVVVFTALGIFFGSVGTYVLTKTTNPEIALAAILEVLVVTILLYVLFGPEA